MKSCIKLAVVDDHLLFRKGLISQLKDFSGLDVVIEAANGMELLAQLKTKVVDVILLDLQMPVMNGAEVTEWLRLHHKDVKIIIVTMHNDPQHIKQLINLGANGFLLKDQEIGIVADAIYGVIENGYYFNELVFGNIIKELIDEKEIMPPLNSARLSEREIEIVRLISKELTVREIAEILSLSTRTIDGHKERILHKIKARSAVGIIMYAYKHNLL